MHNKAYHIFTHKDLDGAVSLLTFIWAMPDAVISYEEITNFEIFKIKEFINKTINPPNIVIMDLSIRDEFIPDLDKKFITIIDHHERSLPLVNKFKNAKILHKDFTSNSLLVRKLLQDKSPNLSESQKKLILFADDYDCSNLKHPESYDLNILFWNQFKNKFPEFIKTYMNGFFKFTENQKNIIFNVKQKVKNDAESIKCFTGKVKINSEYKTAIAISVEKADVLIIDYLMDKFKSDLFICINTKTEKLSIRQKKSNDPLDLKYFCEKYCEGTSNKFSGVGKLNPLFLELTKNFIPL